MAKKNDYFKFRKTAAVKKDIATIGMNSAVRSGAAIAANAGVSMFGTAIPAPMQKFIGPALFLIGVAGEAYAENKTMQAAFQGVQVYGAMKGAKELAPTVVASKIGLSGVEMQNAGTTEFEPEALADVDDESDYVEDLGYIEPEETETEMYDEVSGITEADLLQ